MVGGLKFQRQLRNSRRVGFLREFVGDCAPGALRSIGGHWNDPSRAGQSSYGRYAFVVPGNFLCVCREFSQSSRANFRQGRRGWWLGLIPSMTSIRTLVISSLLHVPRHSGQYQRGRLNNKKFHKHTNVMFGHKIPLGETESDHDGDRRLWPTRGLVGGSFKRHLLAGPQALFRAQ